MKRAVLPLITAGLFAMVVADRISHAFTEAPQPSTPMPEAGTPTLDRLARLAARQQLSREAGSTYLDSLIISTDSVVRRWPDRNGQPLRVAILEGGPASYQP